MEEVDKFNDIEGLAALMSTCDEIISIGNVNAYIAGAIWKNVYILLGHDSLWR